MAQFPCLPLWTDALLADTAHLSEAEFGRYLRLLILLWRTPGCRVPNDDLWLTRHLPRCGTIEDIRAIVREFCETDGNFIAQKRLSHEFRERWRFKGRMTAARKVHKNKTNGAHTREGPQVSLYPSLNLNTNNLSYFGESQCTDQATTSETRDQTTEHPHEPATQDHPPAKTSTPSPPPTADQPDHSKPSSPTSNSPPMTSEHPSNGSQPHSLAEINERMGWTPAGTRKPTP